MRSGHGSESATTQTSTTSLPLTMVAILAVVGAAVSSVSLYEHTAQLNNIQVAVPLCTINETFNCSAVNASRFSMFLGMPVASWGLSFFLAQLMLSVMAQSGFGLVRNLLVGITSFGVLFCIYLFASSLIAVKAVCPLCLGVYLVTIISWILAIRANRPHSLWDGIKSSLSTFRRLLPGATPMGLAHRQGILITLFIGLIGLMAPDFMLVKLIAPAAEQKQRGEAEQQALDGWHQSTENEKDLVTESGPMQDFGYGEVNAPVQVVEFSDYQCPFCRRFAGELNDLVKDFPGKIRVVVRNFPLDSSCNPQMPQSMHELACPAATFARCAGEQGKFKEASTWINELGALEKEGTSVEEFEKLITERVSSTGLDGDAIKECRSATRTKEKIIADAQKAVELGLQGTPLVFVNGKRLEYPSKDVLKKIIVEILTQPKQ
jgi:protein-disulfide isomerase/uncharacterized membrane protein